MKVYNSTTNKIIDLPKVIVGTPTVNGVSEEFLNQNSMYYIEYQSKPNRRYYISEESASLVGNKYVVSYTQTEVDVTQLKASMISEVKNIQAKKLSAIDWYWLRQLKNGTEVPQEIQDEAANIYATASQKEAEIDLLSTIEDIILYEATPYEVQVTDEETNNTITVILYKNNTKDW